MSMLTNSLVKPPVNPQTGLATTLNERGDAPSKRAWPNGSADFDSDRENLQITNGSITFGKTDYGVLEHGDMSDLPDDLFYQRLLKLKDEHKKTLEMCERLYTEKMETVRRERSRSPSPARFSSTRSNRSMSPAPRSAQRSPAGSVHSVPVSRTTVSRDMIRDMSASASKPPIPKRSDGTPLVRPSSASGVRSSKSSIYSSAEEAVINAQRSLNASRELLNESRQSAAMSRIEDMWENFSVDEYTPRGRGPRRRSNSLSNVPDTSTKTNMKNSQSMDQWRHRITIPEPFSMTKREEAKTPTKSKAAIELEEKRLEAERLEEEECQKKFKAKPVPAHIYMPLYDEIMEEQETKRRYNRQKSAELTKSAQKPFKFSTREEEKKYKVKKSTDLQKQDEALKTEFQARPFPEHIFGHTVYDKLAEEEEYRRIRMEMRSRDLLKKSSLPPNMAARGQDYFEGKSRQKTNAKRAKKAGIRAKHSFQPKVNDDMPDFDEMHRKFLNELGRRKGEKEATVCKPFNLRTSRIPSTKQKIYEDIERDEEELRENRWPFQSSRSGLRSSRTGKKSEVLLYKMHACLV